MLPLDYRSGVTWLTGIRSTMLGDQLVIGRPPRSHSGSLPMAGAVERNGPACRRGAVLRCAGSRQRGTAVAAQRPTRVRAGKRAAKRDAAREAEATPTLAPE